MNENTSTTTGAPELSTTTSPARVREAAELRKPFIPPQVTPIGPLTKVTTQFAGTFTP